MVHNIIYNQYVYLIPIPLKNTINEYAERLNMILTKKISQTLVQNSRHQMFNK